MDSLQKMALQSPCDLLRGEAIFDYISQSQLKESIKISVSDEILWE